MLSSQLISSFSRKEEFVMCFVLLACALFFFFFNGFDSSQKNYLNLFTVLQFGTLQKMLHYNSAFSQCDLSSLSLPLSLLPYVFCLSVKLVNSISVYYSFWLFKENETVGTSEQLFRALCVSWTGYFISFQFDAYFGDYLQLWELES